MNVAVQQQYLENEVLTATPQKLQWMLLDAAIRFGQRGRTHWVAGEWEPGGEAVLRCQMIVGELIGSLTAHRESPLVRRVAGVYAFVFRALVEAHLRRDTEPLSAALAVLEVERETWRQVCQQMGSSRPAAVPAAEGSATAGLSWQA
jgi:flagellar protein FliS